MSSLNILQSGRPVSTWIPLTEAIAGETIGRGSVVYLDGGRAFILKHKIFWLVDLFVAMMDAVEGRRILLGGRGETLEFPDVKVDVLYGVDTKNIQNNNLSETQADGFLLVAWRRFVGSTFVAVLNGGVFDDGC